MIKVMRKSGILLPITSLPSKYGIGCFSKEAYEFVDFLKSCGQSYWQILPLGPTGYGDSPYQSFSTFAGNPYMISLEELIFEGLLSKEECDDVDFGESEIYIDYEKQFKERFKLLKTAYGRSDLKNSGKYKEFISENSYWLYDYALFMALKYKFNQRPWNEWEIDIKKRKEDALKKYSNDLSDEIDFWIFLQFKFHEQWNSLKLYANKNNVSIIGDIPIYVSFDSADVWKNPEIFRLDSELLPTHVAGCPPDGFSKKGQLWGNPLYKWEEHEATDFEWWIKRIKHSFKLYDVLRIDHFRGFAEYYSIKYKSVDAVNGEWKKGPGKKLFDSIERKLGKLNIIAEDLGFVTESVKKLLSDCNFPGMKVLQFAFDMRDSGQTNDYLPHNYTENCVAYTGTHDNQTLSSWFKTISDEERQNVRAYICDNFTPDDIIHLSLISLIYRSCATLCIVPIQDWLGLKDDARINIPSTSENNWRWRVTKKQLASGIENEIFKTTERYGRL